MFFQVFWQRLSVVFIKFVYSVDKKELSYNCYLSLLRYHLLYSFATKSLTAYDKSFITSLKILGIVFPFSKVLDHYQSYLQQYIQPHLFYY